MVALLYFTGVAVACRQAGLPWWTAGLSPLLSLITYLAYAADKSAARQGAWRTQENTLHLLALAGGWPGALIARHRLRHKSRKPSFRLMFWITVVVNCGALVWLFSSPGVQLLQALTG